MMAPRLRFAPSPTGFLHVGGARTALFNWLYARRHGGVFILRIEDTDVARSSDDMVTGILDGLRWLGLDWDEGPEVGGPHGPYFQSERLARYRERAEELVGTAHAYYCYCDPGELKRLRQSAESEGRAWQYDRRCLHLDPGEISRREAAGRPRAIRFKVHPGGTTGFDDLVHGSIAFDHANIEDFVVLRSDRHPTYHLSVVVDDIDMQITDIVRGDDHISNTPKQVMLYEAFGEPLPRFAHVPLILGPDRKRLSKRHGATSVTEYQRAGYLPEAMMNFLALLGWSPGTNQELFTRDELVAAFALEGISGGHAVFNPEKLDWFNSEHLARMPPGELLARLEPGLRDAGLWRDDFRGSDRTRVARVLELLKPRSKKLADFIAQGRPFFVDSVEIDDAAVARHLGEPGVAEHLEALAGTLARLATFDAASIETALRELAASRGVKAALLIHAARIAVTGQAVSPGIFDVLELAGRDRTLARLGALRRHLSARTAAG
jgi:glutamyl-tRNA synthetase